ncbi:MAG: hypothetical protein Q8K32_18140 [Archangium sp.]|nr:hypothetical protein [Archangium sp.]
MLAIATNSTSIHAHARPKTRVGVFDQRRAPRVRARAAASRETRWGNSAEVRRSAAGLSQYLSPEPLLQNPNWVMGEALDGHSVPVYAYAGNNPVRNTDPTGLFKLQDPCARWGDAVALAKTWAGCGGGNGKVCAADSSCQRKLAECAGGGSSCNICSILENGMGPDAFIEDVEMFETDEGPANAITLTGRTASGTVVVPWSKFRKSDCESNTYTLATRILHEAAHACGAQFQRFVGHESTCGAFDIAKACRQP